MNEKYVKAKALADKYGQGHLLKYYDELDTESQEKLLDQILDIDFELMKNNLVFAYQNY